MIRYLRRGQLRWRTGVAVASVVSVGLLVSRLNEWPNFLQGYSASLGLFGFTAVKGMGWLRDAVGLFVLMLALGALVEVLFSEVFPQQGGLDTQIRRGRQGPVSLQGWLASGWCVIALALTMMGVWQGYRWLAQHLVPEASGALFAWVTPRIASAFPGLGIVVNNLLLTVGGGLGWMLGISLLSLSRRRWPRGAILMGVGMLLINALTSATWGEVGLSLGAGMVVGYALWVGSKFLVKHNVVVVAAWVAALLTLKEALPLLSYPHPAYIIQGALALLVGFVPCVWLGLRALRLSQRFPHIASRYAATRAPRTNRTPLASSAS